MIRKENAEKYCCEDISKIYGYNEAVLDKENYWDCHHCLGLVWTQRQLIEMGLYYNQPADRLMFVTKSQHKKLHYITKQRIVSKEARKNMSKAQQNDPKKSKKVVQYAKNGEFIKEWLSLGEIQRATGFKIQNISSCCHGKLKSYKGFVWLFANSLQ